MWPGSNQMHGQGTIYWQDGTRYVGNFENHERQGAGMIILPDSTTYEGEFDRGVLIREVLIKILHQATERPAIRRR